MTTVLSPTERNALRPIADGWMLDYKLRLDLAIDDKGFTLDQWIDLAWEKGLLDHVSPTDPEIVTARKLLERTVWPERQNPILYWRIQYAIEYFRTHMERTTAQGVAAQACIPLFVAMGKLDKPKLGELFPKMVLQPDWPWYRKICALLIARAKRSLQDLGVKPHMRTLRRGSTGVFRGINVEVDNVCDDGTLWLRALEDGVDNANHYALVDYMIGEHKTNEGRGICPSLIDDSTFILPTRP